LSCAMRIGGWPCCRIDAVAEDEVPCRPRQERQCPPTAVREHEDTKTEEDDASNEPHAPEETAVVELVRLQQESLEECSRGRIVLTHCVHSVHP